MKTALAIACVVVVLGVSVNAPSARASDDRATMLAKRQFYRGQRLFDLRRFKQALKAYENAYEAKPIPAFLFNIAQCHYNLGDFESALFSYRRFLRLKPRTSKRAAVEQLIIRLKKRLEASRKAAQKTKNGGIDLIPNPTGPSAVSHQPIYKTWWLWTGLAVVGAASAALILSSSGGSGVPSSDLGNLDFRR